MPKGISIVKGHAYGNDFLLAPESHVEGRDLPALARAMCSRHEGHRRGRADDLCV